MTDEVSTNTAMLLFLFATGLLVFGVIWMGHMRYMLTGL
jgi:hypothetical protein